MSAQKEKIKILSIFDSNLKFQSLALLLNVIETQPTDVQILFYYVYEDEDEQKEFDDLVQELLRAFGYIERRKYINITYISQREMEELTQTFSLNDNSPITRTAFLRLFFLHWFPSNIQKILYLDIDVLIMDDLSSLFELEFSTPICAELNSPSSLANGSHLQGEPAPYFNAGVILIDVNKWRDMELTEKFLKVGSRQAYLYLDQDILNEVFRNNWTRLGRDYNYFHLYGLNENDSSYSVHPKIVHFVGKKPWGEIHSTEYVKQYRNNFDRIRFLSDFIAEQN